jgi:uncharacterized membrane protein
VKRLANYFLRGLVIIVPVALTLYVCWTIFVTVDRWFPIPIPGVGFVVAIGVTTLVGFLGSNLLAQGLLSGVEAMMGRLPLVRMLYAPTRDLLNAFVGEQRRFNRPVAVSLTADPGPKLLGFMTRDSLTRLGLEHHVAVYLPQSYNFAGMLVVVPSDRVTPLEVESADLMAFIVSGGIAERARPATEPG